MTYLPGGNHSFFSPIAAARLLLSSALLVAVPFPRPGFFYPV